jgi:hypothetical protein
VSTALPLASRMKSVFVALISAPVTRRQVYVLLVANL